MEETHLRSEGADDALDRLLATTCDDLVVASNRQPYRHTYDDGAVDVDRPAGGLTAGLDAVMRRIDGTWVAWGDGDADAAVVDGDDRVSVPPEGDDYTLQRLWLSEDEVDGYYYRISNRVLWPVCHAALATVDSCRDAWSDYRRVNDRFADAVAADADGDDLVWLQDYHLALASRLVRERSTDEPVVAQSWHIPWPSWDTFRACPHREELLRGLLGNDLLGFHVPRYCENFLESVEAGLPDAEVDAETGRVRYDGATTTVRAFPMGVPVDRIREQADSDEAVGFWAAFRKNRDIDPDTRVAVGVDRLDYTKGIPQRLDALEHLLAERPRWRGEFTYVQVGTESRSDIPAYRRCQERVAERVEAINDRFGTDDHQPVVYTTEMLSNEALAGLYRNADLAVVSPVRDGMNLVAQEYVAAQADGDGVHRESLHRLWEAGVEVSQGDAHRHRPQDPDAEVAIEERHRRRVATAGTVTVGAVLVFGGVTHRPTPPGPDRLPASAQ